MHGAPRDDRRAADAARAVRAGWLLVVGVLTLIASPALAVHDHPAWDLANATSDEAFARADAGLEEAGDEVAQAMGVTWDEYEGRAATGADAIQTVEAEFSQLMDEADIWDNGGSGNPGSSDGGKLKVERDPIGDAWKDTWDDVLSPTKEDLVRRVPSPTSTWSTAVGTGRTRGAGVLNATEEGARTGFAVGADGLDAAADGTTTAYGSTRPRIADGHRAANGTLSLANDAARRVHGDQETAQAATRPVDAVPVGGTASATGRPTAAGRDAPGHDARSRDLPDHDVIPGRPDGPIPALGMGAAVAIAAGIWILYRRLSRDDVLDNDLRSRILGYVEADPGVHPSSLADDLDVAHQTVRYHLRVLEEFGEVELRSRGGNVHCFRAGVHDADDRRLAPVLTSASKRALLGLLVQEPGLCIAEAARRLDRDRSTVKRHVDALEDDGVVCSERRGSTRVVAIADGLREAVASRLVRDG